MDAHSVSHHTDDERAPAWLELLPFTKAPRSGDHLYYVDFHYLSSIQESLIRSVGIYGHLWARNDDEAREMFLAGLRDLDIMRDCIESPPEKAESSVNVYPLKRTEPATGKAAQRLVNTCPECTESDLEQRGGKNVCPKCGFILPCCDDCGKT